MTRSTDQPGAETTSRRTPVLVVTLALLGLLALTAGASLLKLGPWGLAVALFIAALKACVVGAWFMELIDAARTIRVAAGIGIVWFLLLLGGVLADRLTREPVARAPSPQTQPGAPPLEKRPA